MERSEWKQIEQDSRSKEFLYNRAEEHQRTTILLLCELLEQTYQQNEMLRQHFAKTPVIDD